MPSTVPDGEAMTRLPLRIAALLASLALALTSAGFLVIGLLAWQWVKKRVP